MLFIGIARNFPPPYPFLLGKAVHVSKKTTRHRRGTRFRAPLSRRNANSLDQAPGEESNCDTDTDGQPVVDCDSEAIQKQLARIEGNYQRLDQLLDEAEAKVPLALLAIDGNVTKESPADPQSPKKRTRTRSIKPR